MNVPLSIRYQAQPQRAAVAWLLPGADPRGWLAELLRWELSLVSLELWLVPISQRDLNPRGVLVRCPSGTVPKVTPRGQPYGLLADRLYLPVDAQLFPAVGARELESLIGVLTYIWHPQAGLTSFEDAQTLRASDLLAGPTCRETDWSTAQPGMSFAARLLSVDPEQVPTLEMVLEQGRSDIGRQVSDLDQLPPASDEPPSDLVSRAGQSARELLARATQWLASQAPTGSGQPTWIDRLDAWSRQVLEGARNRMTDERYKEIHRLLHLLNENPDEGLKYALPTGGDAPRGIAAPGAQLTQREVDFSLRRLGGGGPADVWNLPDDMHQQLIHQYRELANREIRLGRHRRAAYIFAELLGDLEAAATALAAGQHHREAAILYRDRLKRPWDAARCLEQGGLWSEAIGAYEELGDFERAGDLYASLDQTESAGAAYRKAVSALLISGDRLSAATLLREKLAQRQEALEVLEAGWPHGVQAHSYLNAVFQLRGELGMHDQTARWIEAQSGDALPRHAQLWWTEALAEAAQHYPDQAVRDTAADHARITAAGQLASSHNEAQLARTLDALKRLATGDRLLSRDCDRFRQRSLSRRTSTIQRTAAKNHLTRKRLPQGVSWRTAVSAGESFFVAGYEGERLVVVRGSWSWFSEGRAIQCHLGWPVGRHHPPILLCTKAASGSAVEVHAVGGESLEPQMHIDPSGTWSAEPPRWNVDLVALVPTATSSGAGIAVRQGNLVLLRDGPSGGLQQSLELPEGIDFMPWPPPLLPLPAGSVADLVTYGVGQFVGSHRSEGLTQFTDLGDTVVTMASDPDHRRHLVCGLETGLTVLTLDDLTADDPLTATPLSDELTRPVVGFSTDGSIIAADEQGCEVYCSAGYSASAGHRFVQRVRYGRSVGKPIAILRPPHKNQFAVCTSDGWLYVYEMP